MKNKILIGFIFFYFLSGINMVFAQSDYEIVQNFKKRVTQIEEQIKDADSLSALREVENSIGKLKSDFLKNKELLDKSLYPDNFDKTISDLERRYTLRQGDFSQIEELHTTVTTLKVEIDTLTKRNSDLAKQFEELETKTSQRIEELEKTVARLNASLQKRDQVVMNMIDSLLPSSVKDVNELSSREKQQVISEAEQSNVLYHIKRAVEDNIRFINATKLQPEDIEDLKQRQQNFFRIWSSVGPTLVELYAAKGKSTNELKEIDEAFSRWHNELNREVWESIRNEFAMNDIRLQSFSSGEEFTSVVTNYIDDEIKNADTKGNYAEDTYKNFVDSTWYRSVESEWIPFLLENKMLSENNKDSIEVKIASWKETIYPGGINWLYIIVAVVVIAVLIILFTRKSKKEPRTSDQTP